MHIIGCRDLRWRGDMSTGEDLEEGNDCSIEVQVQYPPMIMNTHWLIWWTAKVQIASTRSAGDPLRFDTMKLQALPFQYPQVWQGKLNAGLVKGVLCIMLLSAVILAALSQLRHLKTHGDAAPYVSLVMLGAQALGFGMPLIAGIDALRAKFTLGSDMADDALIMTTVSVHRQGGEAVKVLSLAALVLTLRLCHRAWRSRARAPARLSPPARGRVPGEAKVFVFQCAVHLAIFVLTLAFERAGHGGPAAPPADAGPVPALAGDRQRRVARQLRAAREGLLPGRHRRARAAARVRLRPATAGDWALPRALGRRHPVPALQRRRRGDTGRVRLARARSVCAAAVELRKGYQ